MTISKPNFTADRGTENAADMSAFEGSKIIMPKSGQSGHTTYTTSMVFVSIYRQRVFWRHVGNSGHIRYVRTLIEVIWKSRPLCPLYSPIAGRAVAGASA